MDRSAILRDYQTLRAAFVRLSEKLLQTLDPNDIRVAAKKLGMLHGKTIDLQTEDELSVAVDYALFDIRHDGLNALDRYLLTHPLPEGHEDLRLLRSMQRSHYALLSVVRPDPGLGVHCLDGPQRTPVFLVDIGFSHSAQPDVVLATRIHSPGEGWWITTGTALPVDHAALEKLSRALGHKRGDIPVDELTALIIRACITSGASRHIVYASPDPQGGAATLALPPQARSAPRIGRNDPCPCGSGKKHKKCCGRWGAPPATPARS